MKLFIPIPIFWALYDQQGSRWTIQAARMNGEIGSFLLQADQLQVFNPLLVLVFIPLFETCIYPLLAKIGINTPLRKLSVGGLLAALSFVVSAIVQLELEVRDQISLSQEPRAKGVRPAYEMRCFEDACIIHRRLLLEACERGRTLHSFCFLQDIV